jgi:hypothetical protein
MLAALSPLFDQTCTIREWTSRDGDRDAAGQPIEDWANLALHVSLPCRIAPVTALTRAARVARSDMTVTTATHVIFLPGEYPSITTAMQASIDGTSYQIVSISRDSEQLACELEVEKVTT